ncbi:helix-turn-helix domain-containing protein [Streptomyces sp. NPDC057638]|uniref:helix-turn-helix domain-containing protein n=1 Tax=Streptomyces sp. NPDC057638 TaxID=3346190 RepID=UPI0036AAC339
MKPHELIRQTRRALNLTLAQVGERTGYSAAQVSRYERGITPLTDITVLRRFADALDLPHQALGLTPPPDGPEPRHGRRDRTTTGFPLVPTPRLGSGRKDGDDPLRRRRLLAGLAATAATAAVAPPGAGTGRGGHALLGELLVARLRDAMLGLGPTPAELAPGALRADVGRAVADFGACRYASLAVRLPRIISAGHALTAGPGGQDACGLLAQGYLLATRMLVKLDARQLGWMCADRARQFAETGGDVLHIAESARQLAVLARSAGWHPEALSIALTAADDPALREAGPAGTALKGLLVQSAAYTQARCGDRDGMRELTAEAVAIARELGDTTRVRDHGGFSPLTVQLHQVSAECRAGDPRAALDAARTIPLKALPTVERRSRALGDIAGAYHQLGRRSDCLRTLLHAERLAPEETHARPATRNLVAGLLASGPTTSDLRGLADRSGLLA